MAKDTPKKPEGAEVTPADEQSKQEQAAPGDVVVSADKINELASERQTAAKAATQQAEPSQEPEAPAPEEQVALAKLGRKGRPPKSGKTEKTSTPIEDEKAYDSQKKTVPKKSRAARLPTGIKKEEPAPKESEIPPVPVEAPRPERTEEITYISLPELFLFKDHPFQVRDDEEMRAMVESVKDKGVTQPAIVRPCEDGGYELVSGHRRQNAS